MANKPYKRKGSNNFYLQVRVPQKLIHHYNKQHLTKSLRTSNLSVANKRALQLEAELHKEFDRLLKVNHRDSLNTQHLVREMKEFEDSEYEIDATDHPAFDKVITEKQSGIHSEEHQVVLNALAVAKGQSIPLHYVIDLYKQDNYDSLAENTRKSRDVVFNQLIEHYGKYKDITKITTNDARDFVSELKKKSSNPGTINTKLQNIILLYNYAMETDIISGVIKIPFKAFKVKVKGNKSKQSSTPTASYQGIKSILEFLAENPSAKNGRPLPEIIRLAYYTGARPADIFLMSTKSLSTDRLGNLMIEVENTKQHSPYSIPVHPEYIETIEHDLKRLEAYTATQEASQKAINAPLNRLLKRMELPFSSYGLRNHFEQALKDAGVNLEIRLYLEGKSSLVGSQQHYGEATMDSNLLTRELAKLPVLP